MIGIENGGSARKESKGGNISGARKELSSAPWEVCCRRARDSGIGYKAINLMPLIKKLPIFLFMAN